MGSFLQQEIQKQQQQAWQKKRQENALSSPAASQTQTSGNNNMSLDDMRLKLPVPGAAVAGATMAQIAGASQNTRLVLPGSPLPSAVQRIQAGAGLQLPSVGGGINGTSKAGTATPTISDLYAAIDEKEKNGVGESLIAYAVHNDTSDAQHMLLGTPVPGLPVHDPRKYRYVLLRVFRLRNLAFVLMP